MAETPFHFFKVILPSILDDKKLRIPERFAKNFGNELSAVSKLTVPNGRVWQVGLTKDGRKIWFQDGWHDFVQYHSICEAYMLVFKYARNSTFDVLIFDKSACEIYYPNGDRIPAADEQKSLHQDETEHKPLSSLECSDPKDSSEPQNKRRKMEELTDINISCDSNENNILAALEETGIYITERHKILSNEEKNRAINIARSLRPKNPSFMLFFRSNYSHEKQYLNVPVRFVTNYIGRYAKVITLQVSDGREWAVGVLKRSYGGIRFAKGWSRFSNDQNLKAGDICVFELVRKKDITLEVSVFHAGGLTLEPIKNHFMAVTPFHFFKVILPSVLDDKKLRIPTDFVRKFVDKLSSVATIIVPNGRIWQVRLRKYGRKMWFCAGWHEFVGYHSIGIGYFLVFKYERNSIFHVIILDTSGCEIHYPCNGEALKNDGKNSINQDETENEDPVVGMSSPLRKKVFRKCPSKIPSSKMYSATMKNRAKPSRESTVGIKRTRNCTDTLDISKSKHSCDIQSKKCKMEEVVAINETDDKNEFLALLKAMGFSFPQKRGLLLSVQERERAINVARHLKPRDPSFMRVFQSDYNRMYVPLKFAKMYLSKLSNHGKLQDSDGREWPIIMLFYSSSCFITKGWAEFTNDKNLERGDICVFELIRKDYDRCLIMKVSVYPMPKK